MRNFVDLEHFPLVGVDKIGYTNEWNLKVAGIKVYSREESMQKHLVSTFIVPFLRKSIQDMIDSALQGNKTSNFMLEFEKNCKDHRYLMLNTSTRHGFENSMMGVAIMAQATTEAELHNRTVAVTAF